MIDWAVARAVGLLSWLQLDAAVSFAKERPDTVGVLLILLALLAILKALKWGAAKRTGRTAHGVAAPTGQAHAHAA